MKKRIQIQGFLIFLGLMTSIILSKYIFAHRQDSFWDIFFGSLGLGLLFIGFLFRISARGYKKDKAAGGAVLVIDGPYAYVRNPMYLGTFLIGSGIILAIFKGWVFLLFLFIFLCIYIPQTRGEERALKQRFGESYVAYIRKTSKFFPNLKVLFKKDLSTLLPLEKSWIENEISSFLSVFVIFLGLEFYKDLSSFGIQRAFLKILFLFFIGVMYAALLFFLIGRERIR